MTNKDDDTLRDILEHTRTIAVVGASPKPDRPSNDVMKALIDKGFDVHPVNPGHAGTKIHGQMVYASLDDVPPPIDMVDVFLNPARLPGLVDDVVRLKDITEIHTLWTQEGIRDDDAVEKARAAGLAVVQDQCAKKAARRLDVTPPG